MKPTKARIELMQAIADGAVSEHWPLRGSARYSVRDLGPGATPRRYQRVTASVAALRVEGLARVTAPARWSIAAREWELTPAGETWLKANGGAP